MVREVEKLWGQKCCIEVVHCPSGDTFFGLREEVECLEVSNGERMRKGNVGIEGKGVEYTSLEGEDVKLVP